MRLAIITGAIALAILGTAFSSFYTIDQGQRGILLTNGAYTSNEDPGLHFKAPFFQSVVKLSTQQQTAYWGFENERPIMEAYSRDQQAAKMLVSVTYHVPVDQVEQVYAQYGSLAVLEERTVARVAPQTIKTVFGQYDAVSVIQSRSKFNAEVSKAVIDSVSGPVVIDAVQIENIDFSDAYEQAVEARMTAQVEVQKQDQNLLQEKIKAEIAVTQARGRADSVKAEADANAYKVKAEGVAQADAIKARAAALGANPLLVQLTQAERWNGQLPATMIPGGAVPLLNLQ
ncbi:MAG: prohibitin family protein [Mesorhizobium sp.]|uniref:prohibitin family protein n=1 Tax=Mesorhizobium sp. TaxID=1871066 RepID=UPI000FE9D9FD|nr:prohibitin family protein [Mesorhizobium sp.]RWB08810.1 MAG: prohibitin family protein [Mesorhizobium sp.]RWB13540.1 MAG: prohibitin family protein [Mesorhizobium sp.]